MYLDAGKYRFIRSYISWHLRRSGYFSPWQIIGVVYVREDECKALYIERFSHFEDRFIDEWKKIKDPMIRSSKEALEHYRKKINNPFSVMTPVITYYTRYVSEWSKRSIWRLSVNYIGHYKSIYLAMIGVMIRMKDEYFPCLFKYYRDDTEKSDIVKELQKKGFLQWLDPNTSFNYSHRAYVRSLKATSGIPKLLGRSKKQS